MLFHFFSMLEKSFYYFLAHIFASFYSNPILLKIYCKCWLWLRLLPPAPAAANLQLWHLGKTMGNYQPTCLLFMLLRSPFVLEFTLPHLTQINSERSQSVMRSHHPCLWLDFGNNMQSSLASKTCIHIFSHSSHEHFWVPNMADTKSVVMNKTECLSLKS